MTALIPSDREMIDHIIEELREVKYIPSMDMGLKRLQVVLDGMDERIREQPEHVDVLRPVRDLAGSSW